MSDTDRTAADPGETISLFDDDGKKKSQSTLLIELADRYATFHDQDHNAYAIVVDDGIKKVLSIAGVEFKRLLSSLHYALTGKGANANSIRDAIATIEAKALNDGKCEPVYLRVANLGDRIYIDLGDANWRVIAITSDGWQILDQSPVHFIRRNGMAALPDPEAPGDVALLERFLNIDKTHYPLVVGWLLGALKGSGPFPVLVLQGEQGSGKSSLTKALRALVDPSTVPLRSPPRETRDLLVSAANNFCVTLDNLSGLTHELSDCLCRFATGGGHDARKLYSDMEQCLVDIQRPIIVNGIDDIATRPDLSSRSIILNLPIMASCMTEAAYWREFDTAKGRIFAGLLDGLSGALRGLSSVHLSTMPRMADFAVWVTAAETALQWTPGNFMERYTGMQERAVMDGIEASPVGGTLVEYLRSLGTGKVWSPTPTHLYDTLTEKAGSRARSKAWPQTMRGLHNSLNRLAPSLRAVGVTYYQDINHHRLYHFIVEVAEKAPQAPQAPQATAGAGFSGADKNDGAHRSAPNTLSAPEAPSPKSTAGAGSGAWGAWGASKPIPHIVEGDRI